MSQAGLGGSSTSRAFERKLQDENKTLRKELQAKKEKINSLEHKNRNLEIELDVSKVEIAKLTEAVELDNRASVLRAEAYALERRAISVMQSKERQDNYCKITRKHAVIYDKIETNGLEKATDDLVLLSSNTASTASSSDEREHIEMTNEPGNGDLYDSEVSKLHPPQLPQRPRSIADTQFGIIQHVPHMDAEKMESQKKISAEFVPERQGSLAVTVPESPRRPDFHASGQSQKRPTTCSIPKVFRRAFQLDKKRGWNSTL